MGVIKENIGKKIRNLRNNNKLTQEKLSELIGVNQRQLTRIETGKSIPSIQTLENLCIVFQITPSELFDFRDFNEESAIEETIDNKCIMEKIVEIQQYPQKIKFIQLALDVLNKDINALQKMQSLIEGMLMLEE